MGITYNDDGLSGAHRICLNIKMDVTRSQTEGWNTGVFSFVLNNRSAVNQGSDPATNAIIVIDPNAGMSVYEYDVNPASDFTGAAGDEFSDVIFNTEQATNDLGATYNYSVPVLDGGQGTQEIEVC